MITPVNENIDKKIWTGRGRVLLRVKAWWCRGVTWCRCMMLMYDADDWRDADAWCRWRWWCRALTWRCGWRGWCRGLTWCRCMMPMTRMMRLTHHSSATSQSPASYIGITSYIGIIQFIGIIHFIRIIRFIGIIHRHRPDHTFHRHHLIHRHHTFRRHHTSASPNHTFHRHHFSQRHHTSASTRSSASSVAENAPCYCFVVCIYVTIRIFVPGNVYLQMPHGMFSRLKQQCFCFSKLHHSMPTNEK